MATRQQHIYAFQNTPQHDVPRKLAAIQTAFGLSSRLLPGPTAWLAERLFFTPGRKAASRRAQRTLAQAERIAVRHAGGELVGYAWGRGPLILLVHGWGARAAVMYHLVEPLTAAGFRVVAFDAPAHGDSPGKQTNLLDFGNAIGAAIAQHGPVYGVFAHSIGGAALLYLLEREPDLPIERIALNGSPSDMRGVVRTFCATLNLPERIERGLYEAVRRRVGRLPGEFHIRRAAAALRQPGLVIHDRDDEVVPFADGQGIAQAWAGARFVPTEGLGHRGALRNRAALREVVTFFVNGA